MSHPCLGLGCWAFGKGYWHDQRREDSIKALHAAIRGGIRHFDTAQGYGKGLSEQITGQQLKRFAAQVPRESYRLATKLFLPASPDEMTESVARSLRRLCTSYVDIMYIHWPDSHKDCRPYLEQLAKVRAMGMIKSIGLSNFTVPLMEQALTATEIEYCQIPVSLVWTRGLRHVGPLCDAHGIKIVGYSPLGLGLLSGRYRNSGDLPAGDRRRELFPFRDPYHRTFLELLDLLDNLAKARGTDMATLALAWTLSKPLDFVLTGARTKEQVVHSMRAEACMIDAHGLRDLDSIAGILESLVDPAEDNPFFHRW